MSVRSSLLPLALAGVLAGTAGCGNDSSSLSDGAGGEPVRVVFVGDTAAASLDAEAAAALEWLREQPQFTTRFLQLVDLPDARLQPDEVLWWHYAREQTLPSTALRQATTSAMRDHLQRGGNMLLSLLATPWLVALEIESVAPNAVGFQPGTHWARWGPEDDRLLSGLQSHRGHPILRRFWGGVLTAELQPERLYPTAVWEAEAWPRNGSVVGVGRRYIGLDPGRRVAIEYLPAVTGGGRALAVGEAMYFSDAANVNRTHLELFTADVLLYLGGQEPPAPPGAGVGGTGAVALPEDPADAPGETGEPAPQEGATPGSPRSASAPASLPGVLSATTYWTARTNETLWFDPPRSPGSESPLAAEVLENVVAARSGLLLEREQATGEPFDLASPRSLLLGTDTGTVDELWGSPLRVLRGLRFGIVEEEDVVWLADTDAVRFTARPEGNSFRYTLDGAVIDVHLAVPRDSTGLTAVLAVDAPAPVRIRAEWEVDQSMMWPREDNHLGDLLLGWSYTENAVVWRDAERVVEAWAGFSQPAAAALVGGRIPDADAPDSADDPDDGDTGEPPALSRTVAVDAIVDPSVSDSIAFVVAARADDETDPRAAFRAVRADPAAVWTTNANYWSGFLAETLTIASPDPTLNEAMRWAKVGLEAFRVTTPRMGTGLAAGYAAARRAEEDPWAAENDFLRRPGYGWYFGRDAVWTALAADAYGSSDLAADALRMLARYQDVDGKIFHEMSPGWVLHYDAADATPLFLLGLEHHVRTTGDRDLLRELWPTVRRAMLYLISTDTDGDGLIENTDVGHGWIEGGKFYGAHTTYYLAGVWAATLEATDRMAAWVGDEEMQLDASTRAAAVRETVNRDFWDPVGRYFLYGKRVDGSYMPYRTIMPAVPALLGVVDRDKLRPLADMMGSAEITSDWGTRMAESSSPDYDPARYHQGSVWPLYTGWAALASYTARRPLTAFFQTYSNLRLVRQGSLGFIPEALHGDVMEPAGITQHQAWSHAMTVLPLIRGLLGVRPDAINGVLQVHPQLPGGWRELTAQRVRVGDNAFNITVRREDEASVFEIDRVAGSESIQLDLMLPFPRRVLVNLDHDRTSGVAIPDGEDIVDWTTEKQVRVVATLTEDQGVVVFRHSPFPEVVQPLPAPSTGAASESLRILDGRFVTGSLNVKVEGLAGRTYRFNVTVPWAVAQVAGPRGSRVINPGPGRAIIETVIPGPGENFRTADLTISFRR